ncbi:hypothetical protein D3M59_02810 [Sphingomonas edaphi]|uniref:Uncharacterized protein n=2 Tax=Sphingomonas edaphi TaxID=2315689 RepID=A0A418Q278_9SPHN|nr:hypothetical protein D3M59_02810 [Sphingomonas edaphi]
MDDRLIMSDLSDKVIGVSKFLGIPMDALTGKPPEAAKTRDELKQRLGSMGEAAIERAEWSAVVGWLTIRPEAKLDPALTKRLKEEVEFYMIARAALAGLPDPDGNPLEAPYVAFHRSRQSRIKKRAMQLREQWREAGEQCITSSIGYVCGYLERAKSKAARKTAQA